MVITDSYLLSQMSITPWAIHRQMLTVFTDILNRKLNGEDIRQSELIKSKRVRDEDDSTIKYDVLNRTAIIPLHGVVLHKSMGMEGVSGMVKVLDIENSFKMSLEDPNVDRILLHWHSPGGTVEGTKSVSDLIYNSRGRKQIISYADGLMASAAYWMGSAADIIVADPTADVGSIGVYMMHVDASKAVEDQGFKVKYIKAGKYKTVGNPYEPLSEFSEGELQSHVDYIYSLFVEDVARNRGVSVEEVASNMAEGRVFIGQNAKNIGLVDSIEHMDGVISSQTTYDFLRSGKTKGESEMDVKKATAEDVARENADVYAEISNSGVVKYNEAMQILEAANRVGMASRGFELVKEGKSLSEALATLLEEKHSAKQPTQEQPTQEQPAQEQPSANTAFIQTAPKAAGPTDADQPEGPATQNEARKLVQDRDNCSKGEAWRKAKKEYPNLFNAGWSVHQK